MIVANFMDSSLKDLVRKGVLESAPELYNPRRTFEHVFHFTPYADDLELAEFFAPSRISLVSHPCSHPMPHRFLGAVYLAWRLLRREHVDVVRGRLPYLGSLIGCIAARLRGVPSIVSLGGDNRIGQERSGVYQMKSRYLSYSVEWVTLKLATRILVPNRFTKKYVGRIIGTAAAERKCVVIPWPSRPVPEFEADAPDLAALFGLVPTDIIVPVIGFLNPYKYTDVLFRMLEDGPLIGRHGQVAVVCFCGDGPLHETGVRRFAGRRDVRFLGWQDQRVVRALLRRADVVMVPMSGFVLLEAASLAKPVVTSAVEWHSELVADGRSGLVVEPTDADSWRDAVQRLLTMPLEARAFGAELQATYWRDYAPERAVDGEIALYRDLAAASGRHT